MPDPQTTKSQVSHRDNVPDHSEFARERALWRNAIAEDAALRRQALKLQQAAERHHYTYTWEWLGVPIIRLPDDIVVLQELFWSYRPQRVVETGVARGGSMLLNASLMQLCGEPPAVLGVDVAIFPHTRTALAEHPHAVGIELHEDDSTSPGTQEKVRAFLSDVDRAVLVLDSNHTHAHVLAELRTLTPMLPVGSVVMVADTLIEELPAHHFGNRPWDRGNNPATAVHEFLGDSSAFEMDMTWSRRALVTEFRDGILRRIR